MIIYISYNILKDKQERAERIRKLNKYYEDGNQIHVWIEDTTLFLNTVVKELEDWGCKFSYIKLGKPVYDILIDDNSYRSDIFFKN